MSANSSTPVFFGGISSVTATRSSKDPEPGTRVTYDGNDYLYIYYGADTQASPGMYVCPGAATSNYTMTITGAASYEVPAGVVKHATFTTNTYGWVLTKGYAPAYVSAAVAAGIGLETVASTGLWTTAATGTVYGKLLSASSAATNVTAGAYWNF
jgi:hypothetical protein